MLLWYLKLSPLTRAQDVLLKMTKVEPHEKLKAGSGWQSRNREFGALIIRIGSLQRGL